MVYNLRSPFIIHLAVGGCGLLAPPKVKKKPTWRNTPGVSDHVGLLANEPPGTAGLLFI
jgi:hypothetical protein